MAIIPKRDYNANLVAKWIFDNRYSSYVNGNTIYDLSGNGRNLSSYNITYQDDPDLGRCAYFNGVNGYMNAITPVLPIGKKSIKIIFKSIEANRLQMLLNNNNNGASGSSVALYNGYNQYNYTYFKTNEDYLNTYSNALISTITKTELLITNLSDRSVNNFKIYLNNFKTPDKTDIAFNESILGTQNLYIGNQPSLHSSRYFKGYIKSIEIYNDVIEYIDVSYLLKQNNQYYTIKTINYDSVTAHNFIPLTLSGGMNPISSDIDTYGFSDLSVLTNSMTVGSDIFKPIDKFDNTAELKLYKG